MGDTRKIIPNGDNSFSSKIFKIETLFSGREHALSCSQKTRFATESHVIYITV